MAGLELRNVVKAYGPVQVLHGINLDIGDGEFVVFVGPSGCGKSPLLRMIAGLETITGGTVKIGETLVNDVPPRSRDIAMVFQDYALYPHLSVRDNMAFGLKLRKAPKADIDARVDEAARILQIGHLLDRKPRQLSGGQRQRVAMGRAIVRQPKAFLFDEPLSNLDAKLRSEMRVEIKKLHQQLKTTIIYVTHDQVEAMTLADRIVVMKGGYVQQVGAPDDIYNHPANQFVAGFMGAPPMNFLPASLTDAGDAIDLPGGNRLSLPEERLAALRQRNTKQIVVGLRPEQMTRLRPGEASAATLDVPVTLVEPLGSDTLAFLKVGGVEIVGRFQPEDAPKVGETVRLNVPSTRLHLFDAETGQAIR